MKRIPTPDGPFPTRLYFTDDEIEEICSAALNETGLLPTKPERIRIDRLIDKKFDVSIVYEDLGKNVLGFTEFGPGGVEAVHIGEPPGDLILQEERRVNSTLAHEAGHGLMHAQLFVEHFANQTPIEGHPDVTEKRILCREERPNTVRQKEYKGDWWEFQANRAIGALLMPKQLLPIFLEPFHTKFGTTKLSELPAKSKREIVEAASDTFDVNQIVARVRLNLPYV